jgi:predicted nucleic acid-binding protein
MTAFPVFVDANIPLYASGMPHPMQVPCAQIMLAAANAKDAFVTDAEALQEVLHVSRRGRRSAKGRTIFQVFAATVDTVFPIEREDLLRAAELAEQQQAEASTRDCVHAAVMQRRGIERIVSADRGFDRLPGVTRLDPLAFDQWGDPSWLPPD